MGGEEVCQHDLGISTAAQSSEDSKLDTNTAASDHPKYEHNDLPSHKQEGSSGAEEGSSITIETTESTDTHVPTPKTDDSVPTSNSHEAVPYSPRPSSPAAKATEVPPQPKCSEKATPLSQHEPIEQPLDNLFVMIRQQRKTLLEGPRISVHFGKLMVDDIPKRAAMAASPVLNEYFTKNPQRITYRISISNVLITTDAVQYILKTWMHETCVTFEAFAVPLQPTMTEDLAILRASTALGMENYTDDILQYYVRYFKSNLPTYEEIVTLEQHARSRQDPLWKIMVRRLCHLRYKKNIPDPDDFAAFLEDHEKVKIEMEKQDKFLRERARRTWGRYYHDRGQQSRGKQGEGQASMPEKEGETDS